jgi:hypothetical protein
MAGFEIVVRPVVFPDIRPAPAQPVPPANDPNQGFATISGNGGHMWNTATSYSASASSSTHSEIERRSDEARVYQKTKDGKINKKNFVDVRAPNRIRMKGPPSQKGNNNPSFNNPGGGPMTTDDLSNYTIEKGLWYYRKIEEKDNIEIRKRNIITKKDGQESGGE